MFETGDVIGFETDRAAGHGTRPKMHLVISVADGIYLFINSHGFRGSMKITKADFPEMHNEVSHISCNAPVRYSEAEIAKFKAAKIGRISANCLKRLSQHLFTCGVIPDDDAEIIQPFLKARIAKG